MEVNIEASSFKLQTPKPVGFYLKFGVFPSSLLACVPESEGLSSRIRTQDSMSHTGRQSANTSDVLSVIMGGGQGTRLFPLTKERAKPAVPLAGKYRLVDIPISNCINSGLRRIYLLTQFNSASLHRHISQ